MSTLKTLLGHAYDIMTVDAKTLIDDPWMETCSLLVIPGGRDLPYCRDLNGKGNERIKEYVAQGGRYWGICAGAYYASTSIEFEKGKADMEVCGERQLAFFPGQCRGTIFPGFVYNSERGARAALVDINLQALASMTTREDLPPQVDMYYNGGGAFIDASQYPNVEVLARYNTTELESSTEQRPAAAIQCSFGRGTAFLVGIHPEYDVTKLDSSNPDYAGTNMIAALTKAEPYRKEFLRTVFARMGLKVAATTRGHQEQAFADNPLLSITPLYLTASSPELYSRIADSWKDLSGSEMIIKDTNDTFYLQQVTSSLPLDLSKLTLDADEENPVKRIVLNQELPDVSLTPNFSLRDYYSHLIERRKAEFAGGKWFNFGSSVLYAEIVTSTQTMLDKNFKFSQTLPSGFVCSAAHQVAGRGRGRNSWVSIVGALQFSLVLRHPTHLSHAPVVFIQYLISLAFVEAIRSKPGYENIPLRLKWPNDIYAESTEGQAGQETKALRKIGGVLVNSSYLNGEFLLVIGCGTNISNPLPTTSVNALIQRENKKLISKGQPALPLLTREQVLADLLVTFERMYDQFCEAGFAGELESLYYKRWLHSGAIVRLKSLNDVQVRIEGITSDYGLLKTVAIDPPLDRYTLQPDGNSFDMLKGLIGRKES
ncbi:hypothetical protein BZG36_03628 [Bifiguratus adelaidae]|uniref:BPL/LPL catalytic domain-containing protein n=1 Tax=Bifiguratus adelaidae TaxID=1938954 RepID=A0A261Y0I9_9FUNG|nr:hypothetical protein BZG36_03628 [Bifiguratus adelaidae]